LNTADLGSFVMERSAYAEMAAIDEGHWWYRARRTVVGAVITRFVTLPDRAKIVEIGCGTGSNLPVLTRFGDVTAIEPDAIARKFAATRSDAVVVEGRLPNQLPIDDASQDLAVMLDVLEHVDDDVGALKAVAAKLAPNARFLLTVPAVPSLWSPHDEEHHHKRRYTKANLTEVIEKAGLQVEMISYFNTLLFPLIATVRWSKNLLGSKAVDTGMPAQWLNALLEGIFGLERAMVGRWPMPIGVSLIVIVKAR
jgi:SAM-dependent methyltransferase